MVWNVSTYFYPKIWHDFSLHHSVEKLRMTSCLNSKPLKHMIAESLHMILVIRGVYGGTDRDLSGIRASVRRPFPKEPAEGRLRKIFGAASRLSLELDDGCMINTDEA